MTSNRDWLMRLAHEAPDELAAWMDAEHVDVIADETNGIADGFPLVARDPVEIMRKCSGMEHGMGSLRKALGIECVSGWQMRCLKALADMVERDYVRRDDYDFMADALKYMKDERDEWKAKAEGSSKVRAGSSSAKRAAAVERLKDVRYHTLADYVRAMLGWGHEPHFEDCRDALIDLLTDESCGQDADQGKRAEAPVRGNLHDSSKETQKPRSREADSGNVSDSDGENLHVEQDTREKLEADVREHFWHNDWCRTDMVLGWLDRQAAIAKSEWAHVHDMYIADLRKERDEAEKRVAELGDELHRSYDAESVKAEVLTLRAVRITELQEQVGKLTAERDSWRTLCGELLDTAHTMQLIADKWEV